MNPKPDKFLPGVYGGIIMAVISTIPFLNLVNCLCCAGILFGGLMAVYFYKNNFTPDTPPFTAGDCMAVGAIAGVVSAVVGTFLSLAFISMFGNVVGEYILEVLRNSNLHIPDESLEQIEEMVSGKGSTVFLIFLEFGQHLLLDTIFGLLGGLIGYSIFKPRVTTMPPPSMPPPSTAAM
ncbi:MAG: hypothetical protein HYR76_14225 [Ignavibacteria bacterium]|nr:hypothetical protein [Ignavibacteria bacterium]MBI3766594.1 hypothetical protein [Ignavibacteriales bacterium]